MTLNLVDFETVLDEIQPILTGGWIQKIHQPQALVLTLEVHSPGTSVTLYICTNPSVGRVHLISKKCANPFTPPPFCQLLRSHLEGGRIEEIKQQQGDRLLYLRISKNETHMFLVISLMGNSANIFLLNEKHILLRSIKESRLTIGERFVPSTAPAPRSSRAPYPWREMKFEHSLFKEKTFPTKYPISAAMQAYYDKKEKEEREDICRTHHLVQTRKALKVAKGKLRALHVDLEKAERYREYGKYGELLKSTLATMRKGQETVTLTDYFDPTLPTLTLPLEPAKDPVRNMETYFRKHHKFLGAQEHLVPRIVTQQEAVEKLVKQLAQLEEGKFQLTPSSQPIPKTQPSVRASKVKPMPALGYRTYTSMDGLTILIGKTAKDNDHLTFKIGKPDDLWLHARGTPGSHAIVRLEKGQSLPHETLKDAAALALWFSDLRKSGKGEVIYTFRKFVKKAKGQKPGAVHVTREKSLWIELKKERLERLKSVSFQAPG